jgi:hypothetical protein
LPGSPKARQVAQSEVGANIFDGLTAEALVLQGRARDVLIYLETLEAGFAG